MPTELSKRLDEAITNSGYSDYKIAHEARIAQSTVNNYRKGLTIKPDIRKLEAICKVIGVSLEYITTGQGDLLENPDADILASYKFKEADYKQLKSLLGKEADMIQAIWKEVQKDRQDKKEILKTFSEITKHLATLSEDIRKMKEQQGQLF